MPETALREALLNALIHRNYAVGAPVQIRVHADRLRIWKPGDLPEHWTTGKLLGPHASHPFNPNVANAFFRSGQIESWGRGIQRIYDACHAAGAPEPRLQQEPGELWLEFPFAPIHLASVGAGREAVAPVKTPVKILEILRAKPETTLAEVADLIGKSKRAVERASAKLAKSGRLKYVGPPKGGHWEAQP